MYFQLSQRGNNCLQLLIRSEIMRLISMICPTSIVFDFLMKLTPSANSWLIESAGTNCGKVSMVLYSTLILSLMYLKFLSIAVRMMHK